MPMRLCLGLFVKGLLVLASVSQIGRGDEPAAQAPKKIVVELKVVEINTTKMQRLGFDWQQLTPDGVKRDSINPLGLRVDDGGVVADGFSGFLEALRQNELARILAEPTLVTLDGRPASFEVGGQIASEFVGTRLEVCPVALENGHVRLDYRIEIAESKSQSGSSVTRLEPSQKAAHLKLDSSSEFELGKMRLVGRFRSSVPFAAGKLQETETLVLARVDLVKAGSLPTAFSGARELPGAQHRELPR